MSVLPDKTTPRTLACLAARLSALFIAVSHSLPSAGGVALRAGAAQDEIAVELGERPLWLAGRGGHRPATFRHDPLSVQVLYLEQRSTSLALVGVDVIGLHHHFVDRLRDRLREQRVVDHLFVFATHTHSAPDTIGAWGPDSKTTGLVESFLDEVRASVERGVREAKRRRVPARLAVAQERTGTEGWLHRSRGPLIVDDTLSVLVVERARTGERIGTLVNYAAHPETLAPPRAENTILRHGISADYVHYLRAFLPGKAPVVYANGAVGTVNPPPFLDHPPGDEPIRDGEAWARRFGRQLAERVALLGRTRESVTVGSIDVRTERVRLPVENVKFVYGHCLGIFGDRPFYRQGSSEPLSPAQACALPPGVELESEVSLIDVGTVRLLAIPGEIFPEFIVGYGLEWTGGPALAGDDAPCPPPVQEAPRGPFLRELLGEHGRFLFVLGLANDEIGYIVPGHDFVLDEERPWVEKAKCGSHYHETNSLGPRTGPLLLRAVEKLRAR